MFYPFTLWSYAMRYILLLPILFALILSPASAQTELKKPGLYVDRFSPVCLFIMWDEVAGAVDYQVRLTKIGPGMLKYAKSAREQDRLRGWRNWKELANTANGWSHDYGIRRAVLWCDLERGQHVKVRVRAVDAEGNVGPQSVRRARTKK